MKMVECQLCAGEMKEGVAVTGSNLPVTRSMGGMFTMPGMDTSEGEPRRFNRLKWKEQTGEEKGWIIKRKEEKTYDVKGYRCLDCGNIILFIENKPE
jgi:hypothetical protein